MARSVAHSDIGRNLSRVPVAIDRCDSRRERVASPIPSVFDGPPEGVLGASMEGNRAALESAVRELSSRLVAALDCQQETMRQLDELGQRLVLLGDPTAEDGDVAGHLLDGVGSGIARAGDRLDSR